MQLLVIGIVVVIVVVLVVVVVVVVGRAATAQFLKYRAVSFVVVDFISMHRT